MQNENANKVREEARATAKYAYISHDFVNSLIKEVKYFRVEGTTTLICAIVLKNGFVVHDSAACVDERNYKQDMAERISLAQPPFILLMIAIAG